MQSFAHGSYVPIRLWFSPLEGGHGVLVNTTLLLENWYLTILKHYILDFPFEHTKNIILDWLFLLFLLPSL